MRLSLKQILQGQQHIVLLLAQAEQHLALQAHCLEDSLLNHMHPRRPELLDQFQRFHILQFQNRKELRQKVLVFDLSILVRLELRFMQQP